MSSERAAPTSDDAAIRVEGLSKEFRFYDRSSDRLRELLLFNRRRRHTLKRALDDVSFTVRHGESVGVMGRNGAGKTTLLSILTGTMAPTAGTVDVYGRVGAILGLGVGFLSQYTGRENLRNGLIARGVPSDELAEREAEVIEFSELGGAVDNLLRTYSSGMNMRLGFSLAISVDPDILIVDEALAVGDAAFQDKCQRAIRGFMERGKTLFFVSHNTGMLETVCDRGIVLERGRVVYDGGIREAVRQMRLRFFDDESLTAVTPSTGHWGDPGVELVAAEVAEAGRIGGTLFQLSQCDVARIRATVRTATPIAQPAFGVIVRNALGREVCGYSTVRSPHQPGRIEPGEFAIEARIPMNVRAGTYRVEITVADIAEHPPRLLHTWEEAVTLRVGSRGYTIRGAVDPGIEILYSTKVYSLATDNARATRGGQEGAG